MELQQQKQQDNELNITISIQKQYFCLEYKV